MFCRSFAGIALRFGYIPTIVGSKSSKETPAISSNSAMVREFAIRELKKA